MYNYSREMVSHEYWTSFVESDFDRIYITTENLNYFRLDGLSAQIICSVLQMLKSIQFSLTHIERKNRSK